jgi:HEAT repeat protein
VLSQLIQSLDGSPTPPVREELQDLFDQLRPAALATVFQWLGNVQRDEIRSVLTAVAERLAAANTAELIRLIHAPDEDVSAEAIRRAGSVKAQAAVGALSRVLSDANAARRLLAVQALTEIASPGALQALERTLEDNDREVRIVAARTIAARAYRPALARFEAVVKSKGVRATDLTEKMVFFEGYGTLCGDSGVAHLDTLLNKKSFLGRREGSEMRACAAIALGRIGTPKAVEALRKAAVERDVIVRNAVARALRGDTRSSETNGGGE